MLVSLPAVFAAKFRSVEPPTFLRLGLAVAGPPNAFLLQGVPFFGQRILLVVNGAVLVFRLDLGVQELVGGHAGRWRDHAASAGL